MCFNVNIEIMTKNCFKSRHYQEFFSKHRAWASLNADVSTYIAKILEIIYSVLKNKIHFECDGSTMQNMDYLCRRWTSYEGEG